ncbi:MAG: HAMP domain-containing histidine kinase [Clostridia bacterium]|nr:HAMP domain-containing histidine kinase [Clostridia bacterium]
MSKRVKRKQHKTKRFDRHLLFTVLLTVIGVLTIAELAVYIVDYVISKDDMTVYSVTLYVAIALAIAVTVVMSYLNRQNNKMSHALTEGISKVADGDYTVELTLPKSGMFKDVYSNFNKMTKELSGVQLLKEEFIQDFSHEFKTPIASINGFANLLLEGGESEEERQLYLKIIADESARLSTLAESTLMLNKLENQQLLGEVAEYRLDLQIKDCIIMLERDWSAKNITISSDMDELIYRGNETLMRQVWLNILTNSIKFTPNGGEISVSLKLDGGSIIADIADNGIGMTEEVASHIFDKYYQGDKSHSTTGNGLGLAIAHRIVTLSRGDISVESKPGEGSKFTVKL